MHALSGRHSSDTHEHVVSQLGDLAGADLTAVELLGSHRLEEGQGPLEVLLATTSHEGKGGVLGSHDTWNSDKKNDYEGPVCGIMWI